MSPDDYLALTFRTHKILATALAGSLLVYAAIVEIMKLQGITAYAPSGPLLDYLRFGSVFLSFGVYFVIKWLNRILLVKKPEDSPEVLVGRLGRANLISLALAELPAFMGFVLFLGSGNSRDFYLLVIISLILFYVFFPRYNYWVYWSKVMDFSGASR